MHGVQAYWDYISRFQAERDWRRKEAEEARKKAETEAMLKEARAKQMDQKEHFLAVQAQRERAEFERVLRSVCVCAGPEGEGRV